MEFREIPPKLTRTEWNALLDHGLVKSTDCLVVKKEDQAQALNGTTGKVDYGEGSDSYIINKVFSHMLTSGRTWKEKVVLKGSFLIDQSIAVPSYTMLDLSGCKFKLADDANVPIIYSENTTDIEIRGGILDGNKSKQSGGTGVSAVRFCGVRNFLISDLHIKDTYHQGVDIVNSGGNKSCYSNMQNLLIEGSGACGVYVGYESCYINIDNIIACNSSGGSQIDQDGLILAGETGFTHHINVDNFISIGNARHGGSLWWVKDVNISNFQAYNNTLTGFGLLGDHDIQNVKLEGIFNNNRGWDGISIITDGSAVFSDLDVKAICHGNYYDGTKVKANNPSSMIQRIKLDVNARNNGWNGVGLSSNATSTRIYDVVLEGISEENNRSNVGAYGVMLWRVERILRNMIVRNQAYGGQDWNIETAKFYENEGVVVYSGDNSCTLFTIPHKLCAEPSSAIVTPGHADVSGDFYVNTNDSYIYVCFLTAPPVGNNNVVLYWKAKV